MGLRHFTFITFILITGSAGFAFGTKPVSQAHAQSDSLRYFYINDAPSILQVHKPFGQMELTLYDLYGQVTFQITVDSKLMPDSSFTFYPNGALHELVLLSPPVDQGAEMLQQRMTFGSTNGPEWRVDSTLGTVGQLNHAAKYYWHRHEKHWAKQEVISCQPHPDTFRD